MSTTGGFLAGFALAALGAAGGWFFLAAPKVADADARAKAAERESLRARRDAADSQNWAEAERRRKLEVEDELSALKTVMSAGPPPRRTGGMGHNGTKEKPPAEATPEGSPEDWDGAQLRRAIEFLAMSPQKVSRNPLFAKVARSLKAHGEAGVELLSQVFKSQLDPSFKSVCATLAGSLEDERLVAPLLELWKTEQDVDVRRAALGGLANLPGDAQTPTLVSVWEDAAADPKHRILAVHGLARRRHEIALKVAEGAAENATPPLRMQVLQTLHAQAMRGGWKDETLAALFGRALRTADGDQQRKMALLALEGFWSKETVADLEAFAESAASTELALRARKAADAIKSGAPRPANAGQPPESAAAPDGTDDAAPETPAPPKAPEPQDPPGTPK